jgi:hypothetical protein
MEYLLLASIALLIGACVAALLLEPPVQIRERVSARHATRPRPDRLSPAMWAGQDSTPGECRDDSDGDDAPPYSPQELRKFLQQHPRAASRGTGEAASHHSH